MKSASASRERGHLAFTDRFEGADDWSGFVALRVMLDFFQQDCLLYLRFGSFLTVLFMKGWSLKKSIERVFVLDFLFYSCTFVTCLFTE